MPQEHCPELEKTEHTPRHKRVARYIGEMTVPGVVGLSAACWAGLQAGDSLMNDFGYDMTFYPKGVASVVAGGIIGGVGGATYLKRRRAANKAD